MRESTTSYPFGSAAPVGGADGYQVLCKLPLLGRYAVQARQLQPEAEGLLEPSSSGSTNLLTVANATQQHSCRGCLTEIATFFRPSVDGLYIFSLQAAAVAELYIDAGTTARSVALAAATASISSDGPVVDTLHSGHFCAGDAYQLKFTGTTREMCGTLILVSTRHDGCLLPRVQITPVCALATILLRALSVSCSGKRG